MRDNEKNIHKMGAILQAKKAPEGEVKGAYENSGFSSDRCAAEVMKCDEKKGLTESDVLRALYHMYCAAAYKGNVTMSSETAIGLYNFFNSQKVEIERLRGEMANISTKTLKRFEKNIKDVKVTLGQTWEIQNAIKETLKEMVGDV